MRHRPRLVLYAIELWPLVTAASKSSRASADQPIMRMAEETAVRRYKVWESRRLLEEQLEYHIPTRSPSQTKISAPKSMEKQATLSTEAHAQPPNGPRVRSGQASPPHVSPGGE